VGRRSDPRRSNSKAHVREQLASIKVSRKRERYLREDFSSIDRLRHGRYPLPARPGCSGPKSHRWHVFRSLGIEVKKDVHYYELCLESLRGSEHPMKHVGTVYRKLRAECNGNEETIR
jgi:hypothetical protein